MKKFNARDHERDQAESRVDRLGQVHIVKIYNVYLDTKEEPNISTRSADIMDWSRDQVAKMMGQTVPVDIALESLDEDVFDNVAIALPTPGVTEDGEISSLSTGHETYSW